MNEVNILRNANYKPNFEDKPIQLVRPDHEHKKLVIIEENLKLLQNIGNDLATVAVVGKYHSGKSFLMNQLMEKSEGFGVGPSPIVMSLANGKTISVIFLDTEGFAATNVSENYDAKIFAVSTLMSSFLIYNSVKIIDQADIDYLELLARRTQLFALRSQMSKSKWTNDFNHDLLNFPPLLWVVQDFVQSTDHGESSQEWLKRLMETHVRENEDYVISLLGVFPSIDCQTLFLPAVKKKLLMDLSLAKNEDLTEDYKYDMLDLKQKLRKGIIPKEKNNKPLTGPGLAALLHILVDAANEGSLSEVPSRWKVFIERLEKTATEDCIKFYDGEMSLVLNSNENKPIPVLKLNDHHQNSLNSSIILLNQLLFGLHEALTAAKLTLNQELSLKHEKALDLNEKNIKLFCNDLLLKIDLNSETEIQNIKLPVKYLDLIRQINSLTQVKTTEFQTKIKEIVIKSQFERLVNKLKSILKDKAESIMHLNEQAMKNFFQEAVQSAVASVKFHKVPEYVDISPFLQYNLEFGIHAENFKSEEMFHLYLGNLKTQLTDACEILKNQNEKILANELAKEVKVFSTKFSDSTGPSAMQLPQNESQLESKLSLENRRYVAQYKDSWDSYVDFPDFSTYLVQLETSMSKISNERRSQNDEAYSKEVKTPLKIAKDTILLAIDHYETAFKMKQYMQRVCMLQLNEGKPKSWPDDLKFRVIETFIKSDEDLAKALSDKSGWWSSIIGLLQWIWWLMTEAAM
ncbi:Guanylate-binding protein 5 [Nymphon striatum]|nr:Guanylate-binding protein 5 [Nymphon striatum]